MSRSRWAGRRVLLAAVAGTVLVAVGATYAVAATRDGERSDPRRTASVSSPDIAGTSTKGPCKVAFDTETSSVTPPDDSTSDNTPAGSVDMKKQCPGVVVAVLSSEVTATSSSPGSLHLDMRATCIGTGGTTDPCTVGQQVFAQPGHTFFADGVTAATRTHSMQMVFPGLKRGLWRFEALPGSSGSTAYLGFRTFTVTAYAGG